MTYDESLATRIRAVLARRRGFVEKKMFGGVGFLLRGNMCVGVWKEFLIVRLDPEEYAAALQEPGVKEFDITGRPMTGWVMVNAQGVAGNRLRAWIDRAVAYVAALPAKAGAKGRGAGGKGGG